MAEGVNITASDGITQTKSASPPVWLLSGQAFLAGWIAGGCGVVVAHPLDTIKTLQQTQQTSKTSIRGTHLLKAVWSGHGVRGLYRGLTYPLITYGAVNAAFFSGAEHTRSFMFNQGYGDEAGKLSYAQIYLVGCMGGVAQLGIVCPTELVKIRVQDQLNTGKRMYSGSFDCTRKLWQKYGVIDGFYRGLSATILRDVKAWGVYLVTFEFVRDKLSHQGFHYITSELIAGGLAGSISWSIATPFDVVKSRMQASEHKPKLIPVIKSLYREEGWKAFTRGMTISAIRGFPANAITLFGFAELMRAFERINKAKYG